MVCLSVRSGLDLLLEALSPPAGSEFVVSAVTHLDMARILERHGVVPVPVDLDTATLEPRLDRLEGALTERTQAILVAHLYGGTVNLAPIAAVARDRGLLLVEDCAQSLGASPPGGDPLADVSMFSFGPIKTATALGGAVLRVSDPLLLDRMRELQAARPSQKRSAYAARAARFLALAALARPAVYGALARIVDLDRLVAGSVRGFSGAGDELFERLRLRPSAPLVSVLARRLRTFDRERIDARARVGEEMAALLSPRFARPGAERGAPDALGVPGRPARSASTRRRAAEVRLRRRAGTTAIGVVTAPEGRPELEAREASETMRDVVFLPVYPELNAGARVAGSPRPPTPRSPRRKHAGAERPLPAPSRPETLEALRTGTFDLLVIGAGIVGSRIAYEAADCRPARRARGRRRLRRRHVQRVVQARARRAPLSLDRADRPRASITGRAQGARAAHRPSSGDAASARRRGAGDGKAHARLGGSAPLRGARGVPRPSRPHAPMRRGAGARARSPRRRPADLPAPPGSDDARQPAHARNRRGRGPHRRDGRQLHERPRVRAGARTGGRRRAPRALRRGSRHPALPGRGQRDGPMGRSRSTARGSAGTADRASLEGRPRGASRRPRAGGRHSRLWDEGRSLVVVPWQGVLLLGATDAPFEGDPGDVRPEDADVAELLAAGRQLLPAEALAPGRVLSAFAGLRVLPPGDSRTSRAPRSHVIEPSARPAWSPWPEASSRSTGGSRWTRSEVLATRGPPALARRERAAARVGRVHPRARACRGMTPP